MVDELQRGEGELGAAVAQGLGQPIDDLLLAVGCGGLRDALQGEGRAGTVTNAPTGRPNVKARGRAIKPAFNAGRWIKIRGLPEKRGASREWKLASPSVLDRYGRKLGEMSVNKSIHHSRMAIPLVVASMAAVPLAAADVVTDWNAKATAICAAAKLPPPPAYRAMALVQTATHEALDAIAGHQGPGTAKPGTAADASPEAAVAAANRAMLSKLVPSQQAAIDAEYGSALSAIPDGPAKTAGVLLGEQASAAVLAARGEDGAAAPESYRPRTVPGVYVPTVIPAVPQWPQRKPWVMASPDQFRPGPPPRLTGKLWARDYNEIKALGARASASRTAEQTEIARFWEATGPEIYFGLVKSVAETAGRDPIRNARLFAVAGQAMDDALIGVFDAKHRYGFWRPITAIRNGDRDANPATERDGSWLPLIDTPMHPEYPCAHCTLAGAVGAVLQAEIGTGPTPPLRTSSVTAAGATRSWTSIDAFVAEVAGARVYDGVHYRSSTEVGTDLGKKIGALVVTRLASRGSDPPVLSKGVAGR